MSSSQAHQLCDQATGSARTSIIALYLEVEPLPDTTPPDYNITFGWLMFTSPETDTQKLSEVWAHREACSGPYRGRSPLNEQAVKAFLRAQSELAVPSTAEATPGLTQLRTRTRSILGAEVLADVTQDSTLARETTSPQAVRVFFYTGGKFNELAGLANDADQLWEALDGETHLPRVHLEDQTFRTVLARRHFSRVIQTVSTLMCDVASVMWGKNSAEDKPVVQLAFDRAELAYVSLSRFDIQQCLLALRDYEESDADDRQFKKQWADLREISVTADGEPTIPPDEPSNTVERSSIQVLTTPSGIITLYELETTNRMLPLSRDDEARLSGMLRFLSSPPIVRMMQSVRSEDGSLPWSDSEEEDERRSRTADDEDDEHSDP